MIKSPVTTWSDDARLVNSQGQCKRRFVSLKILDDSLDLCAFQKPLQGSESKLSHQFTPTSWTDLLFQGLEVRKTICNTPNQL